MQILENILALYLFYSGLYPIKYHHKTIYLPCNFRYLEKIMHLHPVSK